MESKLANRLKQLLRYTHSYLSWFLSSLKQGKFFSGNRQVLLVTGADSSHFLSLVQFLESATRVEADAVVVVWNLGLSDEEQSTLQTRFSTAHFRDFPYEDCPDYFDIQIAAGEYAWKPVAIDLTAKEFEAAKYGKILIWCDSGNLLFKKLRWIRRYTSKFGVYSQFSTGSVADWTHPGMLRHFNLSGDSLACRNANGAIVAFDLGTQAGNVSLRLWADLARDKSVIAPEGSHRGNHRQDQALLTCILVTHGLLPDLPFRTNWTSEYRTNCDVEKGKGLNQRWTISGRRIPGS